MYLDQGYPALPIPAAMDRDKVTEALVKFLGFVADGAPQCNISYGPSSCLPAGWRAPRRLSRDGRRMSVDAVAG